MDDGTLLGGLPPGLRALRDLALDLRWTWSHAADDLWRGLDPLAWEQTHNPWLVLQIVGRERIDQLSGDAGFVGELRRLGAERDRYLAGAGWFGEAHPGAPLHHAAYFCMEFGLGESLPLYAGGLGILAGDFLKGASDLGVPVVGVGLLFQEGYFRQVIGLDDWQYELYPYNDPTSLPIQPVAGPSAGWLSVELDFPGRVLHLRVWRAQVGRVPLYLLDSNDPRNSAADRGITAKLYGGGPEVRLMQEIVLGLGGWRVLEALGIPVEVCHLNEGHAALVVLERARSVMRRTGLSFWEAFWATRAGNVFTTHTPVEAGFDRYDGELIRRFLPYVQGYLTPLGVTLPEIVALGRRDPEDESEPFNMAYLAIRGSSVTNAVSRLHETVSRELFAPLFPRRPLAEVPVVHVTNGVHPPTWDSPWADRLWEEACGKGRWLGPHEELSEPLRAGVTDEALWALRTSARRALVEAARIRLTRQLRARGAEPHEVDEASRALDPDALTLGLARRFTEYKRNNLLLRDRARLLRLLGDARRPVQILVAGKAHPADDAGKAMIREWVELARDPGFRARAVFLEDYDMTLAQELVQGVDLWINTPRRPMEASGTSGMKVLVNGGLNLSELDGWWEEAYRPEVGWAIGEGVPIDAADRDAREAEQLLRALEEVVVPEFYDRGAGGLPRQWLARMRASMESLAPRFSTSRMVREYTESIYLPLAARLHERTRDGAALARELCAWHTRLERMWAGVHFGPLQVRKEPAGWSFDLAVYPGELDAPALGVELYADPAEGEPGLCRRMQRVEEIPGAGRGAIYRAAVATRRPADHFTPRVVPFHPAAVLPTEAPRVMWAR